MVTFQDIHLYNKLARKGLVQKITCPFDDSDIVITKIGKNDEPIIYCMSCNANFDLGINTQTKIKNVISEYKTLRNL